MFFMEKNKKNKKKLTLSVSSKTLHNVPHYVKSSQKTSVVVEKKTTYLKLVSEPNFPFLFSFKIL